MDPNKPNPEKPGRSAISDAAPQNADAPAAFVGQRVDSHAQVRITPGFVEDTHSQQGPPLEDLERLDQATTKVSALRGWVEKYANEAAALAALRGERPPDESGSDSATEPLTQAGDGAKAAGTDRDTDGLPSDAALNQWPVDPTFSGRVPQDRSGRVESKGAGASSNTPEADAQGNRIMNEPFGSDTTEMETRPQNEAFPADSSDVPLDTELRLAQQELRRLREKIANKPRLPGRLDPPNHKRDPRATGLRERVAQAQSALDARAERIRSELNAERKRLRAYREKLQEKSRELIEATRTQKAKLIEQRAKLKDRADALSAREAALDAAKTRETEDPGTDSQPSIDNRIREFEQGTARRLSELETAEAALLEREAELDRIVEERTHEVAEALAEREKTLEQREAELSQSSAELDRQKEILTSRLASLDKELSTRREELEVALEEELHARREELEEEIRRREADLEPGHARLEARATALDEQAETLTLREQNLAGRELALSENESDFSKRMDALEARAELLKHQESEIEEIREDLASERAALRQDREEAERLVHENRERAEALKTRSEAHLESQAALESDRSELEERWAAAEERLAELEKAKSDLDAQSQALQESRQELAQRESLLEEDARKYKTIAARQDEVEREAAELASRQAEIFRREEATRLREEACAREQAAQASAREDLAETRERMESLAEELARREREINDRVARAAEIEHGARQVDTELRGERDEIEDLRSSYNRDATALEAWREELTRKKESLEAEATALRLDREQLEDDRIRLEADRAQFEKTQEAVISEQDTIAAEQERLLETEAELARQREDLNRDKSEMADALARVERDRLALRDRERMIEEQCAEIEATQAEMDEARRRLADRIDETRDLRRKLAAKIKRHHGRKTRLVRDVAEVEEQRNRLDAATAEVERERGELTNQRTELEDQKSILAKDRREMEQDREELEQSRRTFEAGLRQLEEDRRDVMEREAALAEKANQLEVFRDRLEDDHAALQSDREEIVAGQASEDGVSEQLASLLAQAERESEQLKERARQLETHEAAVAARASELARAEDALEHDKQAQQAHAQSIEENIQALEHRRAALEAEMSEQRSAIEARRVEAQASIEARREQLRDREREMEEGLVRRREELEKETQDREQELLDELRTKVEAEQTERMDALARREEEVEMRCAARIEEVERDIEQRLEMLESEIKQRRQQADEALTTRERAFEDEMEQERAERDERIEDLRRRRAAVHREARESEETEHSDDDAEMGTDFLQGLESDFEPVEETLIPEDETIERPAVAEHRDQSIPSSEPSNDSEPYKAIPAAAAPSRFRPVQTVFWAVMLGMLAAGFYMWSPVENGEVKGRLVLNTDQPGTQMSSLEVVSDLMGNTPVFEAASEEAKIDLTQRIREERIRIAPSQAGEGVELTSQVKDPAQQTIQQGWIDALGRAYVRSLAHREISESKRRQALETAARQREDKFSEWQQASTALATMKADFEKAFPSKDGSEFSGSQVELTGDAAAAQAEAEAARKALDAYPKTAPSSPIVPREADVTAAMASDRDLAERMAERDSKANEFHRVLTTAISGAQTPLTALLAGIDAFSSEVQRQLAIQTDPDIRRELEAIAVSLTDYTDRAETFADRWDELAPKVASWTPKSDPDLLLEYQKQAESLVRAFYDESRKAFGEVTKQADAIGRGGSEMTQRRIIHNSLQKLSHAGHAARNEWIESVDGVVPANNRELQALRDTLRNLASRIDQGRAVHRAAVEKELAQQRETLWAAGLDRLKTRVTTAEARFRDLSKQAMTAMESALKEDQTMIREMRTRRDEIDRQKETVSRLELDLRELDNQIDRLEAGEAISMAGAVRYEPAKPVARALFDWSRRTPALGLSGIVALLFTTLVWVLSRQRRTN